MLTALIADAESAVARRGPAPVYRLTTAPRVSRKKIRAVLRPRSRRLRHLALVAQQALEGPDPEAALVYLTMLRDRCEDALRRCR